VETRVELLFRKKLRIWSKAIRVVIDGDDPKAVDGIVVAVRESIKKLEGYEEQ